MDSSKHKAHMQYIPYSTHQTSNLILFPAAPPDSYKVAFPLSRTPQTSENSAGGTIQDLQFLNHHHYQ